MTKNNQYGDLSSKDIFDLKEAVNNLNGTISKATSEAGKLDDTIELLVRNQTESMISDIKKSVLCFGLYLPSPELICRNVSRLNHEDAKSCIQQLHDVWLVVNQPETLFSPAMVPAERNPDFLNSIFQQHKEVLDFTQIWGVQTLHYLNLVGRAEFQIPVKYYKDYLSKLYNLMKPVVLSKFEKKCPSFQEDFSIRSKIESAVDSERLLRVYEYLVEQGCLVSGQEKEFLGIFDAVLLDAPIHPLQWHVTAKNGKTNLQYIRVLFETLGVDMTKSSNYEYVENFFCDAEGEIVDLRPRNGNDNAARETKEQKKFKDGLMKVISGATIATAD